MFEVLNASIISTLIMQTASTSGTPVNYYKNAQRNIPKDSHLL
jgi:hypothetical protein